MATPKQLKYIQSLAAKKDVSALPEHLKPLLERVLNAQYISIGAAITLIDAMKTVPSKPKPPKDPNAPKVARNPILWRRPENRAIIERVAAGDMTPQEAAAVLGQMHGKVVPLRKVLGRARHFQEFGTAVKSKQSASGKSVIVPSEFRDITQKQIDWAAFYGMETLEAFDLRVICSMFYAAERLVSSNVIAPELYTLKQAAFRYVDTWADRFARYTLAACAGEFSNRRRVGSLKFVPQGGDRAGQRIAESLWDKGKTAVAAAVAIMEAEFKEVGNFRSSYGGPRWAKIAKTLLLYLEGKIPAIVWADYVWDLSHNGGRFFDKCPLFCNERETQCLLDAKKRSLIRDVIPWAGEYLHPEWRRGLELLEAITAKPKPTMRSLQNLDLIGGDE